jgi:hypothetical protein
MSISWFLQVLSNIGLQVNSLEPVDSSSLASPVAVCVLRQDVEQISPLLVTDAPFPIRTLATSSVPEIIASPEL